jgi:hypothetical protein
MKFKDYIANLEKVFKFQIKTLFPLDDDSMDLLEKALQKYRPQSVSAPKKTMFQTNPLGFTGVKCAEVFIIDVELTVPTTALMLQHDLREILHMHKDAKELKVFGEHSEELDEEMNLTAETDEEKEKVCLMNNINYEEIKDEKFEDYYGDDYNKKFLEYVSKVEKERAAAKGRGNVDAKHPITKWEKQPKPSADDTEQPK